MEEQRRKMAVEQLVDLARLAIDNNDSEKALAYALNAARLSSGGDEDALMKCLDTAKSRASIQRQYIMNNYNYTEEQASKYAAARAICDDMISRGSIMQDHYKEGQGDKILKDAMEDGSSLVCVRCGALIARSRLEQHKKYWCDKIDSNNNNLSNVTTTESDIDDSNSDFDDVDMEDVTSRLNNATM